MPHRTKLLYHISQNYCNIFHKIIVIYFVELGTLPIDFHNYEFINARYKHYKKIDSFLP